MRRLVSLIVGAALSGCMVGPNYIKPQMPTPQAYAEAGSTSRTQVGARDTDLSSWWTQFSDPELNALIRRALADNPDLQAASDRVRAAREQEKGAAGALLPTLSGSGNAVKYDSQRNGPNQAQGASTGGSSASGLAGIPIPSHLTLYSAGFDSTWEADIFGGVRRQVEAAKDSREAAEWARRDGQVSLLAEVANSYMTLRALQARIAIGQEELNRQRDLYGLIGARREHGFTTQLDVNQQTGQVAQAAAQIQQLEQEAAAQIHALGVLTGQLPETLTEELHASAPALPPPPPALPTGLPSELLLRRPDLRQAERRLAAANAEIGVQVANPYPKINLIALASFASPQFDSLLSSQNFATVGVGMISAPIFNGGRTRAAIAQARAARDEAYQSYRGAVLGAFREVEDALARFRAEDERRGHLLDAVHAAENSLQIAKDQYAAGTVTFINVLQAETALLNSRDQLTQSDAQALGDIISVYKALGGGWTEG